MTDPIQTLNPHPFRWMVPGLRPPAEDADEATWERYLKRVEWKRKLTRRWMALRVEFHVVATGEWPEIDEDLLEALPLHPRIRELVDG